MKNLSHLVQGYLGMTPKDKGCENWTEMQSKMEEDINQFFEKEIELFGNLGQNDEVGNEFANELKQFLGIKISENHKNLIEDNG